MNTTVKSVKSWKKGAIDFEIKRINLGLPGPYPYHYCGYCTICGEKQPTEEQLWSGVDVHGSITYNQKSDDGKSVTYGFDCGHHSDKYNPKLRDIDWLTAECERMAVDIMRIITKE